MSYSLICLIVGVASVILYTVTLHFAQAFNSDVWLTSWKGFWLIVIVSLILMVKEHPPLVKDMLGFLMGALVICLLVHASLCVTTQHDG